MDEFGTPYTLLSYAGAGFFGNAVEMLTNIPKLISVSRHNHIDLWLSKYGSVNIAAWFTKTKNLSFNDDDADIVPFIALTSYPFAEAVLCTKWTRMGRYESRARRYNSFHELFYLHPNRFTPDVNSAIKRLKLNSYLPYALIRLSSLKAHHDLKAKGVSDNLLLKIIKILEEKHKVFISSERPLPRDFEPYRLSISPIHIHNVLASASLIVADSQTMIAEAAILGVPGLRINTFAGRIGYLDELERRGLCWSVPPMDEKMVLYKLTELLSTSREEIVSRRLQLLKETIDPVDYFWTQITKIL